MAPRWGSPREGYSPNEFSPLPRPLFLEGENRQGRDAVPLRPHAPPKPEPIQSIPALRFTVDTRWLQQAPHLLSSIRERPIHHTVTLTRSEAKRYGHSNESGIFVAYVVGTRFDPKSRKMVNEYDYARVPSVALDPSVYINDPRRGLPALQFFWRHDRKRYSRTLQFLKARTKELRMDQKQAYDDWVHRVRSDYHAYLRKF